MKANGYELLPAVDTIDLAVLHVEAILNQGNSGVFRARFAVLDRSSLILLTSRVIALQS